MKRKVYITIILFIVGLQTAGAQSIDLSGSWKFSIGNQMQWASPDFDDSGWQTQRVPGSWEDQGFNGYDGYAWYRITFQGNKLDQSTQYYLSLGYIDDADEVYLNGKLIGFSGSMPPNYKTAFNSERKYLIPEGFINFSGINTLAVRVFDAQLAGGIVDGEIGIYPYRTASTMLVNLEGVWDFAVSKNANKSSALVWDKIMVPDYWERQGYRKYDGYAWYKKEFTLNDTMEDKDLVLLMGKIDDFDEVFLNGVRIGETNDQLWVGMSQSFMKLRAYRIPKGILKKNNLIEVLVEDMGIDGGIYEGPVGITTRANYYRYYRD